MRLFKSRVPRGEGAAQAIAQAAEAGADAAERLASAAEMRAGASEQAAREQRTIVSEIRAMREQNHLADLIFASIKRARR
jgi:DNA-binding transcriptional regulator YiaG